MRELIWVLIAVLFAYALFQLYRAWSLRDERKRVEAAREPTEEGFDSVLSRTLAPEVSEESSARAVAGSTDRAGQAQSKGAEDVPGHVNAMEVEARRITDRFQREVDQLRSEVARQRDRVSTLERTLQALREQIESTQTMQGVSPEYNEALVCARRGLNVPAIAERCGISMAEAELVKSLAERSEAENGERDK